MPADDGPLTGTGALPYQSLGTGGEFSSNFEGFKSDPNVRSRPASDTEMRHLMQEQGTDFDSMMAELEQLQNRKAQPPMPDKVFEQALHPVCCVCGAPSTRVFAVAGNKNKAKEFCANHWLKDIKKDGTTKVQRANVSRAPLPGGRGQAGGSADAGGRGKRVLDVLVPVQQGKGRGGTAAVPGDAGNDQGELQEAHQRDAGAFPQIRLSAELFAEQGWLVNLEHFDSCSLDDGMKQYGVLYDQTVEVAKLLERRRNAAQANRCTFCGVEFGPGNPHYGYFPYQDPPGSGIYHNVLTCRNGVCVTKYENTINDLQLRLRGVKR